MGHGSRSRRPVWGRFATLWLLLGTITPTRARTSHAHPLPCPRDCSHQGCRHARSRVAVRRGDSRPRGGRCRCVSAQHGSRIGPRAPGIARPHSPRFRVARPPHRRAGRPRRAEDPARRTARRHGGRRGGGPHPLRPRHGGLRARRVHHHLRAPDRRVGRGRLGDDRRRHDQPRRRGAKLEPCRLPRRAGRHHSQPPRSESARREALRGRDKRCRLAARRVGRGGGRRLREPIVRAVGRGGEAAQGTAPHSRLGRPRRRQDRKAGGGRQPRVDRRSGRRRDGRPRRPWRGDRRRQRADGAKADHPRLPAVSEAGDRGHADARQHAACPPAHPGRGDRRGQRDPRRRRCLHALRRDGDRRAPAARGGDDAADCP